MKKIALSLALVVLGVTGVMNVAIADAPERVTVCVTSAGQGNPNHNVTIAEPATSAPAFSSSPCGSFGGFGGGRVSAADTNDELAETG